MLDKDLKFYFLKIFYLNSAVVLEVKIAKFVEEIWPSKVNTSSDEHKSSEEILFLLLFF